MENEQDNLETKSISESKTEPKLNLITVNNFVVNLRKQVARSRVQIIHKLTRQIEQLQKKKGTDDQKSKNVRKADRFKKEIHIMGKFQKNAVAKFSLANLEKSVEDDAINPDKMSLFEIDQALRKRAMLRIANHPIVAKDVNEFRKKFPEWTTELNSLLEVLGQKSRKKKEMSKKAKRRLERQKRRAAKKGTKDSKNSFGESDGSEGDSGSDIEDQNKSGCDSEAEDKPKKMTKSKPKKEKASLKNGNALKKSKSEEEETGEDLDESDSDQNGSDDENLEESGSEVNEDEQSFVNSLKSLISKTTKVEKRKTDKNAQRKKQIENEGSQCENEENSEDNNSEIEERSRDEGVEPNENEDGKLLAQSLKTLVSKPTKSKKDTPTQKESKQTKTPVIVKQQKNDKKPQSKAKQTNQISKIIPEKPVDPKMFVKKDGQVLIKTINMSGSDSASEDEAENDDVNGAGKPVNPIKDSFFLGGVSDSNDDEEDNDEAKSKENKFYVDPTLNRRQRRENERWNLGERGGKFKTRGNLSNRGRGLDSRGRGDHNRGQGDVSRGRGNSSRGRGDFSNRGEFSGRGDFSNRGQFRGRGDFSNRGESRGRGDLRGRGVDSTSRGFTRGRGEFSNRGQSFEKQETENLHPSWAAKRKVQSIGEFQGKKIKFDDEGESKSSNPAPRNVPPQVRPAPSQSLSKSAESSSLHPSWAARKDQQKGIQAFEGKKIVFDD